MHSRQTAASVSAALAGIALAAFVAAPAAHAQQYKWIGKDGRVHYGDQPPPADHRRLLRAPTGAHSSEAPASGDHRLPYAVRAAATKYPVVLYTAPDCEPCELGRSHLLQRGVPFTEKQVGSAADVKAFNALKFDSTQFPALSVGSQRMVGFEATLWNRMLDAAAYPKGSMLPSGYEARTVEPMSPPAAEAVARVADERSGPASADLGAGGLLIPARQEFVNPIRF